ncbi:MAG: DegV family protein, partial [Syntrophomonadaceae bacterium]|nr:DegV family protein [Syntrophomonadaceae bacterium]
KIMNRYIITDSTAYLDKDVINKYNISVVPLNVHLKDKSFKEGIDISNQDYYQMLKSEPIFPATSQPASGDFLSLFNKMENGDEVLFISLSSKLSGTMQSAQIASNITNKKLKIYIHDSKSAAAGMALQVIKAAEMLQDGYDMPSIVSYLEDMRKRTKFFFMVNDLEYLARGGRIGKAASTLGNIIQLKPILWIDDGEISLFDKVRSKQKALKLIISQVEKEKDNLEAVMVATVDSHQETYQLQQEIQKLSPIPVGFLDVGPVIGTHVGPGSLGIAFATKK